MYKITCDGEHMATGWDYDLAIKCAERYEKTHRYLVVRVWDARGLVWASDGNFGQF